jgi:four helix bundle protein
MIQSYEDLEIWQRSVALADVIYDVIEQLPSDERYALDKQMRRAVTSISFNIAEGFGRHSTKEFVHFLYIAKGSLSEVKTQILICKIRKFVDAETFNSINREATEIIKMTSALIRKLQRRC